MSKHAWTCALSSALGIASLGGVALGHEGDVGVAVINGRVVIGLVERDPVTLEEWVLPGQRVFGAELDAGGFAPEPGLFGSNLGVGGAQTFPAAGRIGFTLTRPLGIWTGEGFGAAGARMRVEFASGAQSVATPSVGRVTGFLIDAGPTGSFDEHYDFFLSGPDGTPPAGVYLLSMSLWGQSATGSVIGASEEFYFVFNFGAEEEAHDAAIAWAEANLVPAPGLMGVLLGVAVVAGRRRR